MYVARCTTWHACMPHGYVTRVIFSLIQYALPYNSVDCSSRATAEPRKMTRKFELRRPHCSIHEVSHSVTHSNFIQRTPGSESKKIFFRIKEREREIEKEKPTITKQSFLGATVMITYWNGNARARMEQQKCNDPQGVTWEYKPHLFFF